MFRCDFSGCLGCLCTDELVQPMEIGKSVVIVGVPVFDSSHRVVMLEVRCLANVDAFAFAFYTLILLLNSLDADVDKIDGRHNGLSAAVDKSRHLGVECSYRSMLQLLIHSLTQQWPADSCGLTCVRLCNCLPPKSSIALA